MFSRFAIPLGKVVNFSPKAKYLANNILSVRLVFIFFLVVLIAFVNAQVHAQNPIVRDTTKVLLPSDSIKNPADSIPPKKGDIDTTIQYTARDSINTSVDGQMIWLYGDAKIVYGSIELEAEEIVIDYANSTLTAQGKRDSLDRRIGYPIFKNGAELYETKGIIYNFKTGRARITEVVTQQGEGYLHGDVVFKNENDELLSVHNSYTTCNLEHPHFEIRSTKTKAIPDDKIVSGPFYLQFNDIPLYPIGFLFGMFPAQKESKSGIIFPSYGEDRQRGFNLRGLGYFFDVSDFLKLSVRGDFYSKGGYNMTMDVPYNVRYKFTGGLNFSYSKTRLSQKIEVPNVVNDFSVRWNHSPQTKGTGRFSASVSAASNSYNTNNNLNYGQPGSINAGGFNNNTRKMNSNISYNKTFRGTPFSMGINLSHNQDLVTEQLDLTAPSLTVNMRNLYPFQRKDGQPTKLDNFSVGYSMTAVNRITNNLGRIGSDPLKDSIAPFTADNLSTFLGNGRNGIRHAIPVGYSFKALRYFTVSPNVSYDERWYFEKLHWAYRTVNNRPTLVAVDTLKGFNRISNYSFSTSFNTRVYGTYFLKKGKVKAIRHVVNPNISVGYTPDFTKNDNYFQAINNNGKTIYQSRHQGQGFVYGGSNTGKSGSIGLGLGNTLEMKVKSEKDTVARKVSLLNSLSFGSSYNLVADSFKLAPISISANTNILDNLININVSATLDPYTYLKITDETGKTTERKIDQLVWKGGGIGRITSATMAMGTNFNSEGREKNQQTREKIAGSNLPEQEKQEYLQNPEIYIDFDIPWSLQMNYNLSYSRSINSPIRITQALQFSGDLSLSQKWKMTFNSGYDFEMKDFTTTNIGLSRDLHCWTMNFNWGPFGRFTYYNFRIAVKASVLQDLKLERRKPFLDNQ